VRGVFGTDIGGVGKGMSVSSGRMLSCMNEASEFISALGLTASTADHSGTPVHRKPGGFFCCYSVTHQRRSTQINMVVEPRCWAKPRVISELFGQIPLSMYMVRRGVTLKETGRFPASPLLLCTTASHTYSLVHSPPTYLPNPCERTQGPG
jgi:hypothetical protein